jgi:hypothetical protein
LLGYDLFYANEATPEPRITPKTDSSDHQQPPDNTPPWVEAWYWTGYPFSAVIGIKNAAFEVIKMPFSLIAGLISGRDTLNYPVQDLLNARDALQVELLRRPRRGAAAGLYRLLTETPLVVLRASAEDILVSWDLWGEQVGPRYGVVGRFRSASLSHL